MFTTFQKEENGANIVCFLKKKNYIAHAQTFLRGQHCWGSMQTGATLLRYASNVTEQQKCWDLLSQKFDRFQTVRKKCQQVPLVVVPCNGHNKSQRGGHWGLRFCGFGPFLPRFFGV